jgi:hypothetical protein
LTSISDDKCGNDASIEAKNDPACGIIAPARRSGRPDRDHKRRGCETIVADKLKPRKCADFIAHKPVVIAAAASVAAVLDEAFGKTCRVKTLFSILVGKVGTLQEGSVQDTLRNTFKWDAGTRVIDGPRSVAC